MYQLYVAVAFCVYIVVFIYIVVLATKHNRMHYHRNKHDYLVQYDKDGEIRIIWLKDIETSQDKKKLYRCKIRKRKYDTHHHTRTT